MGTATQQPKVIKPLIDPLVTIEDEEWADGDLEIVSGLYPLLGMRGNRGRGKLLGIAWGWWE
jgi:hypothetical protein